MGEQGDVNCDGSVDVQDQQAVCEAMGACAEWNDSTQSCDIFDHGECEQTCYYCIEDIIGDNKVDQLDLELA